MPEKNLQREREYTVAQPFLSLLPLQSLNYKAGENEKTRLNQRADARQDQIEFFFSKPTLAGNKLPISLNQPTLINIVIPLQVEIVLKIVTFPNFNSRVVSFFPILSGDPPRPAV